MLVAHAPDVLRTHSQSPAEASIAVVSHELRGPLDAVLFALRSMTAQTDGDTSARRIRAIAERQAEWAVRIVDDLLDIAACSQGKLFLRREVVAVAEIVSAAAEAVTHRIDARRHQLTISLPSEPAFVFADPMRLEQVLMNLLSNAAKYTDPKGHIRLTVEVAAGQVVFRIRDDGRGIAIHLLPKVFDLYSCGVGLERQTAGLGIGLPLVKALIELHGGHVEAFSSGLGQGAEFVVRLPAYAPNA